MSDFVVRAITLFTSKVSALQDVEDEFRSAEELLSSVEKVLLKTGYEVFTKRVSLPGVPRELAYRLVDYVNKNTLVSVGYSKTLKPIDVVELATSGLYVPLLHVKEPNFDDAVLYSRVFHEISSRDPVAATRVAIGFHGENFQTPYFPDSSSAGFKVIGLAFLYSKRLVELLKTGLGLSKAFELVFDEVLKVVAVVKSVSQLPVLVDYSLSPWMNNSVAELYSLAGYSLLEPGAQYYTWLLNRHIEYYSDPGLRAGFNEVMLPYAEDSKLLEYGAKGLIKARDFLAYASTCVAGLDMVVVPESREKLAQLIASIMALAYVKAKPLAFRAIPTPALPGDVVNLKGFGRVPVIQY